MCMLAFALWCTAQQQLGLAAVPNQLMWRSQQLDRLRAFLLARLQAFQADQECSSETSIYLCGAPGTGRYCFCAFRVSHSSPELNCTLVTFGWSGKTACVRQVMAEISRSHPHSTLLVFMSAMACTEPGSRMNFHSIARLATCRHTPAHRPSHSSRVCAASSSRSWRTRSTPRLREARASPLFPVVSTRPRQNACFAASSVYLFFSFLVFLFVMSIFSICLCFNASTYLPRFCLCIYLSPVCLIDSLKMCFSIFIVSFRARPPVGGARATQVIIPLSP